MERFDVSELLFGILTVIIGVVLALVCVGCAHAPRAPQHRPFGQVVTGCARGRALASAGAGARGRVRCQPGRVVWVAPSRGGLVAEFHFDAGTVDTVRVEEIDEP